MVKIGRIDGPTEYLLLKLAAMRCLHTGHKTARPPYLGRPLEVDRGSVSEEGSYLRRIDLCIPQL